MAATPLSNSKPISPSRFKCIFLDEWWLAKQRKGLAVAGITSVDSCYRGEKQFLSSMIAKRHEPNVLETEDGTTVIFRGLINTSHTRQNGFPSQVCRHFSCGFPHDWNKYTSHIFGDDHMDGTTGFGDSNICSQKRANDALPFSIHDHDLTKTKEVLLSKNGLFSSCSAPKKICSGVASIVGNVSKQLEPNDNMQCKMSMKTAECEYNDSTTNLKSSNSLVDMMDNGENSKNGQPFMGMFDHNPCTGISMKTTVISPNSSKKIIKDQLSSDCKEEQRCRQKEAGDTCSRMVARSISKRSRKMLENGVSLPVRRSPRLHNRRK